ncbi:MAG TPA: SGNH/GDSL hydrolase family protein [Acidimicrobiales bacterium]|nr:SGNH/GDSL hydrolase family protein [Acidimicrobiales bacterium]
MNATPRPLRTRLALAACATLLAGGLSGCAPLSKPGPVLLVGDSIFFLASPDLTFALQTHGWKAVIVAYPGSGINGGGFTPLDWPSKIKDLVEFTKPQAVVVELGTNGCPGCPSVAQAIDNNMKSMADVHHVLWLRVGHTGGNKARADKINKELEAATDRWSNLDLLPYDEWMDGHPDLVPADNVHPTAKGQAALAKHIQDELEKRSSALADKQNEALGAVALVAVLAFVLLGRKQRK